MRAILGHLTRAQLRTLAKLWKVQQGRDKDTTVCNLCARITAFQSPEAHLQALQEICRALETAILGKLDAELRQQNHRIKYPQITR